MPDKRKSAVPNTTDRRMNKPQGPASFKPSEVVRTGTGREAAAAQQANTTHQLATFEAAMKLFHARKLKDARELFAIAINGPERDVAQRAKLHMAMCDRRLEKPPVELGSAEDYYNYGIALINTRNFSEARSHLERGVEIAPKADHIHYALALARALGGDSAAAFESLKRAIELEPRNRAIARQDADFAPVANQPPFDALLYPEKKGW